MTFENNTLLKIHREFGKDEAVAVLEQELKQARFRNGELKSELEEVRHELAETKRLREEGVLKPLKMFTEEQVYKNKNKQIQDLKESVAKQKREASFWQAKYMAEIQKQQKPSSNFPPTTHM